MMISSATPKYGFHVFTIFGKRVHLIGYPFMWHLCDSSSLCHKNAGTVNYLLVEVSFVGSSPLDASSGGLSLPYTKSIRLHQNTSESFLIFCIRLANKTGAFNICKHHLAICPKLLQPSQDLISSWLNMPFSQATLLLLTLVLGLTRTSLGTPRRY